MDLECPPGLMDSEEWLDKAVEDGVTTQQEADEISAWTDARPDALDKLEELGQGRRDDMHCRRGPGGGDFGPRGARESSSEA